MVNYQYQQMNNRLSPQFTEHKKYHAVGCWNSRYWHGTNTKMWITTTTSSLQIWIKFLPQNMIVEVGNILWSQSYSWKWLLASSDYIRANNKHKNGKSAVNSHSQDNQKCSASATMFFVVVRKTRHFLFVIHFSSSFMSVLPPL
jgi:hypothetical protein